MTSFYSEKELLEIGFKKVGKNVKISRYANIYSPHNMEIGDNVRIDDFCILSGKIILGNNIHIAAFCALFGGEYGIVMQDFVGVSSRSAIYAASDDYSGAFLTNPTVPEEFCNVTGGPVVLEKHVIIGTGSSIMPDIVIGEGTAVGSMSLVNKSLEKWGIYIGIPCKKIKDRKKDLLDLEEKYVKQQHECA